MIAGASSGIEPLFALAYRKHNILEGKNLYYVDPQFESVARQEGFYSEELMEYVAGGGSIRQRQEVPEWVKRVFITAADIAPEWHVRMQAAFQESVDAAISKTINFPNSATLDDVRDAYTQAWKLGCKGITVYRAGSREQEVLTAGHKESASAPTGSGPVEPERSQAVTSARPEPFDKLRAGSVEGLVSATPRKRPQAVRGVTERVRTGHGNMYITLNFDEESKPFEVFSTLGKAGGCDSAQLEAISRLVSLALRSGIGSEQITDQLRGITCCPAWNEGELVKSGPDAVALVLSRHLKGQEAPAEPSVQPMGAQLSLLPRNNNGNGKGEYVGRCPECNGLLSFQEGCVTCHGCGYNKCG